VIGGARGTKHSVSVAVDEAGKEDAADLYHFGITVASQQFTCGADSGDFPIITDNNRAVVNYAEF
jgi:hypothetical protein